MRIYKQNNIFLKSLVRYKLIKNTDKIDLFLANYPKEKRELLEKVLAEILAVCTEKIDLKLLKKLLLDKIKELNLDVNISECEAIYIALAKAATKKIAVALGESVTFVFDEVDTKAIDAMRKSFYWMGKEYNQKLQDRLKELIEKTFTGEISNEEIPGVLKAEFGSIIGADENYFKGVAEHISLQAQNIATITEGKKYGVKFYKVLAVMDERTSEICRSMNGRIIPASHLEKQADKLLNAKNLAQKKNAAVWRNKAYLGRSDKMDENFGLPPYHFRCRTEVIATYPQEQVVQGVTIKNTKPLKDDEAIRHIDKMGVERVLSAYNYYKGEHSTKLYKKALEKDIIKGLNSIKKVAPSNKDKTRLNAMSDNGFFFVFSGNEIVTFIPFKNKKELSGYFKDTSITLEQEIIKRWIL